MVERILCRKCYGIGYVLTQLCEGMADQCDCDICQGRGFVDVFLEEENKDVQCHSDSSPSGLPPA